MQDYITTLNKARKEKTGETLLDSTKERYIYLISKFEKRLRKCNKSNIVEFMNKILQERGNMGLYSAFKYWLIMLGEDPRNKQGLIKKVYLPRYRATSMSSVRKLQSKVLTRGQIRIFFEAIDDDYILMLFKLLYDTACRREELCGIQFNHVTFYDEQKNKSMTSNGIFAEIFLKCRKGGRNGVVYLGKESADLLKKFKKDDEEYVVDFRFNGIRYKDQPQQLYLLCRKYGDNVLNVHLHPHMFRHTRLQHMADLGVPVLEIMSYAGHKNVETTMVYVHNSKHQSKNAFIKAFHNSQ